jgi:hypothetical protein
MNDRIRLFRNDNPNVADRKRQDPRLFRQSLLADEVAEVGLLLPLRHCAVLESAAIRQGITIGQLLRRLVAVYVAELESESILGNSSCSTPPAKRLNSIHSQTLPMETPRTRARLARRMTLAPMSRFPVAFPGANY